MVVGWFVGASISASSYYIAPTTLISASSYYIAPTTLISGFRLLSTEQTKNN